MTNFRMVCNCESDAGCDMRVVLPCECASIATDSKPERVPVIAGLEWMTNIPPDRGEMSEAAFVASLFEGVPHAIGERRVQEYQRQKQLNEQLARAAGRRPRS